MEFRFLIQSVAACPLWEETAKNRISEGWQKTKGGQNPKDAIQSFVEQKVGRPRTPVKCVMLPGPGPVQVHVMDAETRQFIVEAHDGISRNWTPVAVVQVVAAFVPLRPWLVCKNCGDITHEDATTLCSCKMAALAIKIANDIDGRGAANDGGPKQ